MHHSGPGRLARPYPVKDLHLLSFASLPGALGFGSKCEELSVRKSLGPSAIAAATLSPGGSKLGQEFFDLCSELAGLIRKDLSRR